jgi:hypothetical protein
MNALDRCLFSLALLLAVFGSVVLFAQGQQAERKAAACQKMHVQQVAQYEGL